MAGKTQKTTIPTDSVELATTIAALRLEIRDLQRSVKLGDAANPHSATSKRRILARLLTEQRRVAGQTTSKENK
jgi:ribosomal protein L29